MVRHLVLPLLMLFSAPALASPPLQAVPDLDLARYAGTWHEIARLPMYFERKCVRDVTATYTPREDGTLTVRNACVKADGETMASEGVARMAGNNPAKLQVRFAPRWLSALPFVWADYWVIAVDQDYRWAIVGEPDRKYLWILAREPALDAQTLDDLKGRARMLGYELDELIVVSPPR
ncbi:MAG: lipocalin family protein [Arenimonas sp.]|uniref:lipocalin family protein n=1 Tax=Arenimonas sp. TaxID=1872635 RepID=UPI0025B7D604|nr:lipocalin family protein [Arenimonas sp.]MBW8369096.1 lipocalin family protein [Arenimonas sp.]